MTPSDSPSLLYVIKRLELAVRAELDEVLRGSGVTTLQYTALTVLERRGSVSAAQLARDSFVTPQSMADMLRTLTASGLVARRPNPRNRRESLVSLTDSGQDLLTQHASAVGQIEDRLRSALGRQRTQDLHDSLSAARDALLERGDTPHRGGPARPDSP